jgi:hypothetical protein
LTSPFRLNAHTFPNNIQSNPAAMLLFGRAPKFLYPILVFCILNFCILYFYILYFCILHFCILNFCILNFYILFLYPIFLYPIFLYLSYISVSDISRSNTCVSTFWSSGTRLGLLTLSHRRVDAAGKVAGIWVLSVARAAGIESSRSTYSIL